MSKKQASSVRSLQTRLEVLKTLVSSSGLLAPGSGVTTDTLVTYWCASKWHSIVFLWLHALYSCLCSVEQGCFSHANADIRAATEQLAAAIYSTGSKDLVPRLSKLLRPKQMEEYQAVFQGGGAKAPPGAAVSAPSKAPAPGAKGPTGSGIPPGKTSHAPQAAKSAADSAPPAEGVCQFCGGCGPHATEAQLDLHYWQACPMLTACPRCQQIVEIATLQEHLLDECEHKASVDPCDRCGDAIEPAMMEEHKRQWFCKPLPPIDVGNRCPLCHKDIPPEKEGWMQHLIGAGCAQNQRTSKARA